MQKICTTTTMYPIVEWVSITQEIKIISWHIFISQKVANNSRTFNELKRASYSVDKMQKKKTM